MMFLPYTSCMANCRYGVCRLIAGTGYLACRNQGIQIHD